MRESRLFFGIRRVKRVKRSPRGEASRVGKRAQFGKGGENSVQRLRLESEQIERHISVTLVNTCWS